MFKSIKEKINIFTAKSPKKAVLLAIIIFNAVFFLIAAAIISAMSQHMSGLRPCTFWESVYYTIAMVFDAGCIDNVITDVSKAGAVAAIICMGVILIGMIFFTGAVIGYVTNIISDFIDSKKNGRIKLELADHIVLINWNARGAEIINEFLYADRAVDIIIFVPDHKDEIDEEIRARLDVTLYQEARPVFEAAAHMSFFEKRKYLKDNLLTEKISVIVREGDVASSTDLDDICISKAASVIILDNGAASDTEKGNMQTVKTLIQVSEISKAARKQNILVEVSDEWTEKLVERIITFKNENGNANIVPVSYNRLNGRTNSQIAVMPELNRIYDSLFSNKGAHFISRHVSEEEFGENVHAFIEKRLNTNCCSIPLTVMRTAEGQKAFYVANEQNDPDENTDHLLTERSVKLKKDPAFRNKNIVVFGHNSHMSSMMEGFEAFRKEWSHDGETFSVIMVDDEESLKAHGDYRHYPDVETIAADIYDDKTFNRELLALSADEGDDTTILILSDDTLGNEDADAKVLTYLIYVQEQIRQREMLLSDFRRDEYALVVEVMDPKNEDIVKNYGADQVIFSSRYVSRIIAQISLGEADFEFYADILSYDCHDENGADRKLSVIKAEDLFEVLPEKCTACELIRSVYAGGEAGKKVMVIGYIRNETDPIFFSGDQRMTDVTLNSEDKLIFFSH